MVGFLALPCPLILFGDTLRGYACVALRAYPLSSILAEIRCPLLAEEETFSPLDWHKATMFRVRFGGHKTDQAVKGSYTVQVRDVARGIRSVVRADGGTVAMLHKSAPLSSFLRSRRSEVTAWGRTRLYKLCT